MNKKRVLIVLLSILFILIIGVSIHFYRIKHARVDITYNDLVVEVYEKRHVSSFIKSINGRIIDDYIIDSDSLGKKNISFQYINTDNIKVTSFFDIKVVDKTAPLIWISDTYSLGVGSKRSLTDLILCGDNYDKKPKCYIEGDYDLNKIGKYDLVIHASDSSKNKTSKSFTLNVYDPKNVKIKERETVYFSDVLGKYKNNKVGLDLSKWQGNVDFSKLSQAGVSFVILRVGSTRGNGGEYVLDEMFKKNISEALKYKIPVGVYFYSYASNIKEARNDARWVIKQIKDYKVKLGVSFDWEDWSYFNSYNISFHDLNEISNAFMDEISKAKYKTMLYSSKNYLELICNNKKYDTWFAHYTDKTNYLGKYKYWQICDTGRVDGINRNVDIDIMYE